MPSSAETHLIRELEHAQRLHEARQASPRLAAALDRVASWQSRRLNATYADLVRDPRYAEAIRFFQSDLYGPGDYSRRDADLARVVPLMVRVLPEGVIAIIAKAIELSALSHELDRTLVAKLGEGSPLSVASYCVAYRACDNRSERERHPSHAPHHPVRVRSTRRTRQIPTVSRRRTADGAAARRPE